MFHVISAKDVQKPQDFQFRQGFWGSFDNYTDQWSLPSAYRNELIKILTSELTPYNFLMLNLISLRCTACKDKQYVQVSFSYLDY